MVTVIYPGFSKCRSLIVIKALACICFLFIFCGAQKAIADDDQPYEEVAVFFNVSGLGGKEIEAIVKNEEVYLSISDLFDFLKIKNQVSAGQDSVSGFFLNESMLYLIDKTKNQIVLNQKTFTLNPPDLIQSQNGLYLKSVIFGKVFGLDCQFDYSSLSVNLKTKLELPAIREKRMDLLRNNISKLKQEFKADTSIMRKYSSLNIGALDWTVSSTQQDGILRDTRINLRLGAMVAGGETNVSINYNAQQPFRLIQQNYLWRYADNDNTALRQVSVGKISPTATSTLIAPLIGVQLTNTPTTYRRSFGTYELSDYTEPNWMVELYVNNSLVDYAIADASGFFRFQVPMIYGNTNLKMRFFGPWGEERIKEQTMNVPYNFLPENEAEYSLTMGMLEDGKQSRFSRFDYKYGLSHRITLGSGIEYLSSVSSASLMPFMNVSVRLGSRTLLFADYTYGVRARGKLNYRMPSNFLLELNYVRYQKGQQAIYNNFLEERNVMLSKQVRLHNFSLFSRLSVNQIVYPTVTQTGTEMLLSGSFRGISTNLTTYLLMVSPDYMNIYSNIAMAFRLPAQYSVRSQIQYQYKTKQISSLRIELEKQLFRRGFLNLNYENNFDNRIQSVGMGLRLDLSFARASFNARQINSRTTFTQSIKGGILYDNETNYLKTNNRTNVGRGGLVLYSFLDLNANNQRDKGEPKVKGLQLKINGGRVQNNMRDTSIQVVDLEPYSSYLLELNLKGLDNIAWQLKNSSMKVAVEPNKLKLIEVPVRVYGEASGTIYAGNNQGQERIVVNFYREGKKFAARTVSEADGYFTFLGLSPGNYTASIDSIQLSKLKLTATPSVIPFNVKSSIEGDVISNLDFKLLPLGITSSSETSKKIITDSAGNGKPAGKINSKSTLKTVVKRAKASKGKTGKSLNGDRTKSKYPNNSAI